VCTTIADPILESYRIIGDSDPPTSDLVIPTLLCSAYWVMCKQYRNVYTDSQPTRPCSAKCINTDKPLVVVIARI